MSPFCKSFLGIGFRRKGARPGYFIFPRRCFSRWGKTWRTGRRTWRGSEKAQRLIMSGRVSNPCDVSFFWIIDSPPENSREPRDRESAYSWISSPCNHEESVYPMSRDSAHTGDNLSFYHSHEPPPVPVMGSLSSNRGIPEWAPSQWKSDAIKPTIG